MESSLERPKDESAHVRVHGCSSACDDRLSTWEYAGGQGAMLEVSRHALGLLRSPVQYKRFALRCEGAMSMLDSMVHTMYAIMTTNSMNNI